MRYNFKNYDIKKQFVNFKINVTLSIRDYIVLLKSIFEIRNLLLPLDGNLLPLDGVNFPLVKSIPSKAGLTLDDSGSMSYSPGVCHGKVN